MEGTVAEVGADQIIYGLEEYLTHDGIRSGEVTADSAYLFRDSSVVRMYTLDMTTYTENGSPRAHIVADSGRLQQRSEEMVAWGEVVLTIIDGSRRIESTELHYDPGAGRIWSDSATTFREANRVTRGSCFDSDLEFRNVRICSIRGAADIGRVPPPDSSDGGGGGG